MARTCYALHCASLRCAPLCLSVHKICLDGRDMHCPAQVTMGPPQPRRGMTKAEREAAAKKEAEDARREKMHAEALEVGVPPPWVGMQTQRAVRKQDYGHRSTIRSTCQRRVPLLSSLRRWPTAAFCHPADCEAEWLAACHWHAVWGRVELGGDPAPVQDRGCRAGPQHAPRGLPGAWPGCMSPWA